MTRLAKKQSHYRTALLLAFISLFVLGNLSCKRSNSFQGYDGKWWANTPLDQKLGFVDGFVDCHSYGCSKESWLCARRNVLEAAISSYYAQNGKDESMPVGEVLIRAAKSTGAPQPSESVNSAQITGAFDGSAWLKYSPKKRLGFVEGCQNALMPRISRSVFFPKSPEYYSDALTRFYSFPPDTQPRADTGEYRIKKRIADVLWGMRNQRR